MTRLTLSKIKGHFSYLVGLQYYKEKLWVGSCVCDMHDIEFDIVNPLLLGHFRYFDKISLLSF